jgi:hypothetical protein
MNVKQYCGFLACSIDNSVSNTIAILRTRHLFDSEIIVAMCLKKSVFRIILRKNKNGSTELAS